MRMFHEGRVDYHMRLFRERPVTDEALYELRSMCEDVDCGQIECLAVKCLLAYLDQIGKVATQ